PSINPHRELCARKGQLGRPVDLFVLLHIGHFQRCIKQAAKASRWSIWIYRRISGSLAIFTQILRASSLLSAAGQRLWGRFLIVDRCVWALVFRRTLWDLILEGAGHGEGRGKTDAT
ncbi:MAG TPA: hypothetical protein VHZ64_06575, partial [Xanthobacteraceae bacterium]|nr:hypothetical protein [Xanthobacteraceae bacterium]